MRNSTNCIIDNKKEGENIDAVENDDDIILAKDIHDCEDCPLYKHDCIGGWTSNGNGTPIEPPCTSWNEEDEIYEGMYENNTYEPSEQELKWERECMAQKEQEQKAKREFEDMGDAKRKVNSISRYGNAEVKEDGELCYRWYCPHCNRWFHAWHESCHDGIVETDCNYCGEPLAHSSLLD